MSPLVGNWQDNNAYAIVHTQSTRLTSFGGGSSAGLDDRFDFILSNYDMNNNIGIEYVSDTYTVFGNDGNHLNKSINDPANTVVSSEVADALYYASDHLPVYADFISKSTTAIGQDPVASNRFVLHQNYPNPFNPATTISYELPISGFVTLKILNTMGQEVKSLVKSYEAAGLKSVMWDGRNNANMPVSSGIYLYKLHIGEFHSTKKLLLLK